MNPLLSVRGHLHAAAQVLDAGVPFRAARPLDEALQNLRELPPTMSPATARHGAAALDQASQARLLIELSPMDGARAPLRHVQSAIEELDAAITNHLPSIIRQVDRDVSNSVDQLTAHTYHGMSQLKQSGEDAIALGDHLAARGLSAGDIELEHAATILREHGRYAKNVGAAGIQLGGRADDVLLSAYTTADDLRQSLRALPPLPE